MNKIAPQWIVDDLEEAVTFYVSYLDFTIDWKGSLFSIISRDNVTLMFRELKKGNLKRPNKIAFTRAGWHSNEQEAWDAYIWVDNVDELYENLVKRKVRIIKNIQNTEYGNRDFEIEDINGYVLCFGKVLE